MSWNCQKKAKELDEDIAKLVMAFRKGLVVFRPGGGGHYGVPFICFTEEERKAKEAEILKEQKIPYIQKTLF